MLCVPGIVLLKDELATDLEYDEKQLLSTDVTMTFDSA